ncbi:hypothetical protein ACO22_07330, partial [Paracoccidioides brasiliensis]
SSIQNLNLDELMDQLTTCATTTTTHLNSFAVNAVTEQFDEHQCYYYENTEHMIKNTASSRTQISQALNDKSIIRSALRY